MFCDQCGLHLQPGQSQCARCGKAIIGAAKSTRVADHVKLVGILWIAYSALHALTGILVLLAAKFVVVRLGEIPNAPPPWMFDIIRGAIAVVGWLALVKAAAGLAAGWGLLQREPWARMFAIVIGFIALLSIPVGAALGIYSLWVLLPSDSEKQYKTLTQAQAA